MTKLEMRLILVCMAVAAIVTLAEAMLAESDGEVWVLISFLVLLLTLIGTCFILLLGAVDAFGKREWKRFAAVIALPLLLMASQNGTGSSNPMYVAHLPMLAGDALHFATMKPSYDRAVRQLPPGHRVRVFVWNGDSLTNDGIVYREGKARVPGLCDELPLWDHYYFGTFGCGV